MREIDFAAVEAARKTLGLDAFATLEEIRSAYKKLAAEHHPDRHAAGPPGSGEADRARSEARFMEISAAHDLLNEYVGRYLYSFKEDDVKRSLIDPATRAHLKRYYDGQYGQLDL